MLRNRSWIWLPLFFLCLSCLKPNKAVQTISSQDYTLNFKARYQKLDAPNEEHIMELRTLLSVVPVRRHRDDSIFLKIKHTEVESKLDDKPIDVGLQGKWVEARVFEHGELLKLHHTEQLTYGNPYTDAMDIVWMIIFPNPPALQNKQKRAAMRRYPIIFGSKGRAHMRLKSMWKLLRTGRNVDIDYRSDVEIQGRWRDFTLSGTGDASGTIVIDRRGGIPARHEGELHRSICYAGESNLCQRQHFQFQLEVRP